MVLVVLFIADISLRERKKKLKKLLNMPGERQYEYIYFYYVVIFRATAILD